MNKDRLREFIHDNFLFGDSDMQIQDDTSFLDNGIIDSTGMLELVNFVEQQFEIRVLDDELMPDNFDSIAKLSKFIEKKLSQATVEALEVPTANATR